MTFPLAQVQPDDVLPFLVGALIFMIPIIGILTNHQRKMALIMRGQDEEGRKLQTPGVDQLRHEVAELRQMLAQQAIAIDNIAGTQQKILESMASQSAELRNRIGNL
jgi:hypothetical protein